VVGVVIVEDGSYIAAIAAIWGVMNVIAVAYYKYLSSCCEERDALREAAAEMLAAKQAEDRAELVQWRQRNRSRTDADRDANPADGVR
jgi:hypothetical protein